MATQLGRQISHRLKGKSSKVGIGVIGSQNLTRMLARGIKEAKKSGIADFSTKGSVTAPSILIRP